jgi:hypothetical protein
MMLVLYICFVCRTREFLFLNSFVRISILFSRRLRSVFGAFTAILFEDT